MEELEQTAAAAEPAESGELYEADAIADAFMAGDGDAKDEAQPAETEAKEEPAPTKADPGGEVPQEPAPEPAMPEGWEDAMWQGLAPEIRAKIAEQVTAHANEKSAVQQAMQNLRAEQERFSINANAQLQQALATMKQVIEGEFSQVNWQDLAQNDPKAYVQLQQMYNQRVAAVQQIQQGIARQVQAYQQQREQEAAKQLHNEFETVLPKIKAMVGAGYDGQQFAKEIADYMLKTGCPQEAVNGITRGYELEMVTKAMMYDKLAANRAAAAKKVAEAPKVQSPTGGASVDEGAERYKKALAALRNNDRSTDALAAVFETF